MLSKKEMVTRTADKAEAVFSKYGLEAAEPVVRKDWIKGDYYVEVPSKTMPVAGNKKILDALRADRMPVAREPCRRQFFRTCIKAKFTASGEEVAVNE